MKHRSLVIVAAAAALGLAVPGVATAATPNHTVVRVLTPATTGGCYLNDFGWSGVTRLVYGFAYSDGTSTFVCIVEDTGLRPPKTLYLAATATNCPASLSPLGLLVAWCIGV